MVFSLEKRKESQRGAPRKTGECITCKKRDRAAKLKHFSKFLVPDRQLICLCLWRFSTLHLPYLKTPFWGSSTSRILWQRSTAPSVSCRFGSKTNVFVAAPRWHAELHGCEAPSIVSLSGLSSGWWDFSHWQSLQTEETTVRISPSPR